MKKKTVGETAYKLSLDKTNYDAKEIGYALTEDGSVALNLEICAHNHRHIFDEPEYFVGFVIASDSLIKGVMRRKFFAMIHMPSPRPEQSVFLYNKVKDEFRFLWCLPAAYSPRQFDETIPYEERPWTMERLYVTDNVPLAYKRMKAWTHAFYDKCFWEFIRKINKIDHLSETEYLYANREKLVKSCTNETTSLVPDSGNIVDVAFKQVENSINAMTAQNCVK